MIKINIANDFSEIPGARYKKDGDFSGEQFRQDILEPKYKEALSSSKRLYVDLDGGYGYATSFLEEAFGGLARIYDKYDILKILVIKSDDEPNLKQEVIEYIENAEEE